MFFSLYVLVEQIYPTIYLKYLRRLTKDLERLMIALDYLRKNQNCTATLWYKYVPTNLHHKGVTTLIRPSFCMENKEKII